MERPCGGEKVFKVCRGGQCGESEEWEETGTYQIRLGLVGCGDELGFILNATGDRCSILSSMT